MYDIHWKNITLNMCKVIILQTLVPYFKNVWNSIVQYEFCVLLLFFRIHPTTLTRGSLNIIWPYKHFICWESREISLLIARILSSILSCWCLRERWLKRKCDLKELEEDSNMLRHQRIMHQIIKLNRMHAYERKKA